MVESRVHRWWTIEWGSLGFHCRLRSPPTQVKADDGGEASCFSLTMYLSAPASLCFLALQQTRESYVRALGGRGS